LRKNYIQFIAEIESTKYRNHAIPITLCIFYFHIYAAGILFLIELQKYVFII